VHGTTFPYFAFQYRLHFEELVSGGHVSTHMAAVSAVHEAASLNWSTRGWLRPLCLLRLLVPIVRFPVWVLQTCAALNLPEKVPHTIMLEHGRYEYTHPAYRAQLMHERGNLAYPGHVPPRW
jgi:hypothetical protein